MTPPKHAVVVQPYRAKRLTSGTSPTIPGQSLICEADGIAYILAGGYWVVIDTSDMPLIAGCTWTPVIGVGRVYFQHRTLNGYGKTTRRKLHRVIIECPANLFVDHKDGNTLDCRRQNLRICTQAENNCNKRKPSNNSSGYKGVYHRKDRNKWSAQISVTGKTIRLGCYGTAEEAHRAYVVAAQRFHGEFARVG